MLYKGKHWIMVIYYENVLALKIFQPYTCAPLMLNICAHIL